MKIDIQKIVGKLEDFFEKENVKKIMGMIESYQEEIVETINNLSKKVKEATDIPCEMITIEKLDMENLREIILETKVEDAKFLALLNGGRNSKDKLEIFLQYMDKNKEALDINKVICIRCDVMAETLKEAFGDKKLLLINL